MREIAFEIEALFVALGFNVVTYPRVLRASTRIRQVIEIGSTTSEEAEKLDSLIGASFESLGAKGDGVAKLTPVAAETSFLSDISHSHSLPSEREI